MRYFASCDWFDGIFKWFIGDNRTGETICTAVEYKNLVGNLKKYMKRHSLKAFEFEWQNNNKPQMVTLK